MARGNAAIDHLRNVPLFSKLGNRELAEIEKLSTELSFSPGRELITEGQMASEFFVLVEGHASVTKGGEKIATLGPGDMIGELALLQERPRNATVVTDDDVVALVIDRLAFSQLLDDIPSLTRAVLEAVAHRLAENEESGLS